MDSNEVTSELYPNVKLIDFEHPERNHFVAINQFRVETPGAGKGFIIPDVVLSVNGIPLVVIKCKDTNEFTANPMDDAFQQLMRSLDDMLSDLPVFAPVGLVNSSEFILLLIDEAHRTQSGDLGDNLFVAFPNAPRLAFTGTPLDDLMKELSAEEVEALKKKWGTITEARKHGQSIDAVENFKRKFNYDEPEKANFEVYLKKFLQSMDIILPNAAANPFKIPAKQFGYLLVKVKDRYKDEKDPRSGPFYDLIGLIAFGTSRGSSRSSRNR